MKINYPSKPTETHSYRRAATNPTCQSKCRNRDGVSRTTEWRRRKAGVVRNRQPITQNLGRGPCRFGPSHGRRIARDLSPPPAGRTAAHLQPSLQSVSPQPAPRNIVGRRFGALVVLADSGERNRVQEVLWTVRCDCGKKFQTSGYTLRARWTRHCGCGRKAPVQKAILGGGEITAARWKQILAGANRRGIQVPLDAVGAWNLFLQQGRRCVLTGRELTLATAALDYHPHEPRWIHRDVVKLLTMLPEVELRRLCSDIRKLSF